MIKINEDYLDRVVKNYSDIQLIDEFLAYENAIDIDNIYNSCIIETLDFLHDKFMREIVSRFINSKSDMCDIIRFNIVD